MMVTTAAKMIIVIDITMAFPPCLSTILPSLSLLRSACQWIPHTYLHHTIIFEDYHQRLPEISITRKLSGTYHQWLPKTALQHQVFEPGVGNRASVCVMEKDLCLCCRLQRSGGDLSLTWTWTCAPVVVCLVAG